MMLRKKISMSNKQSLPSRFRFFRQLNYLALIKFKKNQKKNPFRENSWKVFLRKAKYVLPNSLTTAALFSGLIAIIQGMDGHFDLALISILCAMAFDGLDGRVARMTNTQSAFGEQYDSLSDMLSFGAAPAVLMYESVLSDLGKWGFLAACCYAASVALRLARFNVNVHLIDKSSFQGLPSPAAAALIVSFLWFIVEYEKFLFFNLPIWLCFILAIYAGITMISKIPFYSGKTLSKKHRLKVTIFLLCIVGLMIYSSYTSLLFFLCSALYSISGYFVCLYRCIMHYFRNYNHFFRLNINK